ncbi:MAG: DHHA1 domain-containing protein [Desulfurococcaceae archaeon]
MHAIIAHTDIDGVAAAALYLYLTGAQEYRLFFTEPFLLHRALDRVSSAYYDQVVIVDLGINPLVYEKVLNYISLLRKHDIEVSWYDHHVWEDAWINDLTGLGVKLLLDRSTCATGVVANYAMPTRLSTENDFVRELVRGVCAGDLWTFDHWLGPYYIRLVRRGDKDPWRKHVVSVFTSGKYWSSEFESKVEEHISKELSVLSSKSSQNLVVRSVSGLKIVVAESSSEVENSFLASYMLGRLNADIVVLVADDGKLSFRSRGINIRDLALKLGGGGHLYASGAKVEIPRLIKLFTKISRKILLNYIAELVVRCI